MNQETLLKLLDTVDKLTAHAGDLRLSMQSTTVNNPLVAEYFERITSFDNPIDPDLWHNNRLRLFVESDYFTNTKTTYGVSKPKGHALTLNVAYNAFVGFLGYYFPRKQFKALLEASGKRIYITTVAVLENSVEVRKNAQCIAGFVVPFTVDGEPVGQMPMTVAPWGSEYFRQDVLKGQVILAERKG